MTKVTVYQRTIYDHFAMIVYNGKVHRCERRSTLASFVKESDKMLDWAQPMNQAILKPPFFEIWICRDRGNRYEVTGFLWNEKHGNGWTTIDECAPDCVTKILDDMRKERRK